MVKELKILNTTNAIAMTANSFVPGQNIEIDKETAKFVLYFVYSLEKVSLEEFNKFTNNSMTEKNKEEFFKSIKNTSIYKQAEQKMPYFKYLVSGDKSVLNSEQTIKLQNVINYLKSFINSTKNKIKELDNKLNRQAIGNTLTSTLAGILTGVGTVINPLIGIGFLLVGAGASSAFGFKSNETSRISRELNDILIKLELELRSLDECKWDSEDETVSLKILKRKILRILDSIESCVDNKFDKSSINELKISLGINVETNVNYNSENKPNFKPITIGYGY